VTAIPSPSREAAHRQVCRYVDAACTRRFEFLADPRILGFPRFALPLFKRLAGLLKLLIHFMLGVAYPVIDETDVSFKRRDASFNCGILTRTGRYESPSLNDSRRKRHTPNKRTLECRPGKDDAHGRPAERPADKRVSNGNGNLCSGHRMSLAAAWKRGHPFL